MTGSDRLRCQRCGLWLRQSQATCPRCGSGAQPPRPRGHLLGLWSLPRGAWFVLAHPGLWIWVILPFLVNLGLWVGAFYLTRELYREWWAPMVQEWIGTGWWGGVLDGLAVILYVLVAVVLFRPVLFVVGSPFYDFLSEGVEDRYLGGRTPSGGGLANLLWELLRAVIIACQTAVYVLAWTVIWLPVLLVPAVGTLLYFLAMARLCTFELLDFTFARKQYRLRDKRAFLRGIFWQSFGLGALVNLLLVIPILGWMAYPCGVAGATLQYCDARK